MKPFQTLLLLIVVVLIGGLGLMYWANSVDQVVEPVEVVDSIHEPEAVQETQLDPGAYLIFQSVRTTDTGEQDWANDDSQTYTFYRLALGEATYRANPSTDDLVAFATIEHGPEFGGGLTTTIFGQDLLLHRYQTDSVYDAVNGQAGRGAEVDGVLSLTGEILETRRESWGTFRSDDGRFEVFQSFGYYGDQGVVTVTDLQTGEIIHDLTLAFTSEEVGTPEPYLIDNSGTYLYVHQVCGCEASPSGFWEVNLSTGEIRALHELFDLPSWSQTNLDPETRRLLVINEAREASQDGPFDELVPPVIVKVLDLDSGEVTTLFTDDTQAYDRPLLDSPRQDRYLLRPWKEGNEILLFGLEDDDVQEAEKLTDGWVMDWVVDWLVVDDNQVLSLFNLETRGSMIIDVPEGAERFEYVGSIVISK